ncbi:MAG: beta-ACP synthase [Planctomycetes bacterium]|jgi:nodulation protein E|nr:beta-ACP synthase [Planctomycetota bacterium]
MTHGEAGSRRRVVVTGTGVISALGNSRDEFWSAMTEGRSGIGPIEDVDIATITFSQGGQVRGFDPAEFFESRGEREIDRSTQFGLIAAKEAIEQSGLEWTDELRARTGVVTGCAVGGIGTQDTCFKRLYGEGKSRSHPHTIPRIMSNAGASQISMRYGFMGPVYTLSTACASSNHAIGLAFWNLRGGLCDLMVAGGHEALFSRGHLGAWDAIRVVSHDTCRPFTKDRPGMIVGEGGAMLVLETLEAAEARNATILAELCGFGMTADAHHLTMPSQDGPARAIELALADGNIAPKEVGYVNAHGTGTDANDANEIAAIKQVFGDHAKNLLVSSTKSMTGHAIGAAGAIEAVATVLALRDGVAPPTANFTEPDPACDLDVVPNEARRGSFDAAISNTFAFGGLNAVLAFRAWK